MEPLYLQKMQAGCLMKKRKGGKECLKTMGFKVPIITQIKEN